MKLFRKLPGIVILLTCIFLSGAKDPKRILLKSISDYEGFVITRHVDPFEKFERRIWKDSLRVLKSDVESGLNENTMYVRWCRINALLNDEHTTVRKRSPYSPIGCLKYSDGVFVMRTAPDLRELLGARLISIENVSCDTLVGMVNQLIPGNTAWKSQKVVDYMMDINVLKGLGIASTDTVVMKFEKEGKEIESKIFHHKFQSWSNITYTQIMLRFELSRNYWYKFIENDKVVFMSYNSCMEDKYERIKTFFTRLAEDVEKRQPKKFILDLRGNSGGNAYLLQPLINGLAKGRLARDKKIFVLTGRNTFSAAVQNAYSMKTKANAILIGEETGGNLNHFGAIKTEKLSNGYYMTYSTKLFQADTTVHGGILPDVVIEPSFQNRMKGIDECLNAALEY